MTSTPYSFPIGEEKLCIWILEDNTELRQTLQSIFSQAADMTCPGLFSTVEELLSALNRETYPSPHVLILDLALPTVHGLEAIPVLKEEFPSVRILVYTVSGENHAVKRAIEAGADGYLLKDIGIEKMLSHVRETARGDSPLSPQVARHILGSCQKESLSTRESPVPHSLTPVELQILRLLASGMLKKEISGSLGISYHQVDYSMRQIFVKLRVANVQGAVGIALRSGWIK
ncbi:MAG: response regulator transcription factor [Verrucomicrobiota bacterium]